MYLSAMATLQKHVPEAPPEVRDTVGTPKSKMTVEPWTVQ